MSESKLSSDSRAIVKANHKKRLRDIAAMRSEARFTPVHPKRRRISKRGLRGQPWNTKAWTPARIRDRNEAMRRAA